MSAVSRSKCPTCDHIGAFHVLPAGSCRVNDCPCARFGGAKPEEPEERVLVVRIPDGYAATVSVFPVDSDGS